MNLSLDKSECLQHATYVGYERIHNVCAGTFTDVPWGSGDWVLAVGCAGIFTVVAVMLLVISTSIILDVFLGRW